MDRLSVQSEEKVKGCFLMETQVVVNKFYPEEFRRKADATHC